MLRTPILLGTGSNNPSLCSSSFFTTCFSFSQRLVWFLISSSKAALLNLAKHWHSFDPSLCCKHDLTEDSGHRLCPGDSLQSDHSPAWGNRDSHPFYTRIHTSCKQQKGRKKWSNFKVGSYFTPAPLSYELHLLCQSQRNREVLASSLCVVSEPRRSQETRERVIWKVFISLSFPPASHCTIQLQIWLREVLSPEGWAELPLSPAWLSCLEVPTDEPWLSTE